MDAEPEVRCRTCDRPLHHPVSRANGRGPVCQRGLDQIARRGRRARPVGDQLALDLDLTDHHHNGETQ